MMKDLVTALIFVEDEIQYTDGVDRFQFEIPTTFWGLTPNRKCRIVNTSFFKLILLCFLHLDYEFSTLLIFTINIENGSSFTNGSPELFL